MKVFGRDATRVASALLRLDNYHALFRSFYVYERPLGALLRYVVGSVDYPTVLRLRSPTGRLDVHLFTPHDILTVNEIFCRRDYGSGDGRVFVDIGANIGIATLFFATRRGAKKVYSAEPLQSNRDRFLLNTAAVSESVELLGEAVSTRTGEVEFLIEPTGRYSGIASYSTRRGEVTSVPALGIEEFLERVLAEEGFVDVLKIDTEGNEKDLVAAIPVNQLLRIREVVWENNDGRTIMKSGFALAQEVDGFASTD